VAEGRHQRLSTLLGHLPALGENLPRQSLCCACIGRRSAKKLTEAPATIEESDFQSLREAGWDERGIYQATSLISFLNFSGRMEAASGLPMDGQQLLDQLVRML
jgi:hypothetical protein